MNEVYQSAFLKALGWSLLDSLWQMGILWVLYMVLTGNGKKFRPNQRHTLALLSLSGGFVWFLFTLVINFYKAAAQPEVITVYAAEAAIVTSNSLVEQLAGWIEPVLPLLSIGYLLIAALLFIRFYRQYNLTQRLLHNEIRKADPELRVFLQQAAVHLGIKKKVQIWLSGLVDAPLTLGFWKPVILLPIAAVNHLSIQQTEAIILHELQHIKRNDYLINLLIACADVILFFNPFARVLTEQIRKEREHSCDDLVLQFRYDAALYARSLLILEQNRSGMGHALAVAATGKDKQLLLHRVKRILHNEQVATRVNQQMIAYLLSAVLLGFIGWYNPGKVIVRTISEAKAPKNMVDFAGSFETPDAEAREKVKSTPAPVARPAEGTLEEAHEPCNKSTVPAEEGDGDARPITIEMAQIIELVRNQRLAKLVQELATFVTNTEVREFSLPTAADENSAEVPGSGEIKPYVPSSSFSFQVVEDTTMPRRYIETASEKGAREAMEKSMKALQAIDWQKIEKELQANGKKLDVIQLQQEIQKAFKSVNWKKINEQTQYSVEAAANALIVSQEAYRANLETIQKDRAKKQERLDELQQLIIEERLMENRKVERKSDCTVPAPAAKPASRLKTKKVVVI